VLYRIARTLALAGSTFVLLAATASGWTTTHLAAQRVDADSFDNYDFPTQSVSSTNVEWPVTLLFRNNAEVDKIKNSLTWGVGPPYTTTEYGRMNNSFGWFYDADAGRKTAVACYATSTQHYRVYADAAHDDRNWAPSIGFYVIGTTHSDVNECGGGTTYFGYSEGAENRVVTNAVGVTNWQIYPDSWDMQNPEPPRWEGNHYWSNGGTASQFIMP
jgi:hypothetical protein